MQTSSVEPSRKCSDPVWLAESDERRQEVGACGAARRRLALPPLHPGHRRAVGEAQPRVIQAAPKALVVEGGHDDVHVAEAAVAALPRRHAREDRRSGLVRVPAEAVGPEDLLARRLARARVCNSYGNHEPSPSGAERPRAPVGLILWRCARS